jgi:hypothetical protein
MKGEGQGEATFVFADVLKDDEVKVSNHFKKGFNFFMVVGFTSTCAISGYHY